MNFKEQIHDYIQRHKGEIVDTFLDRVAEAKEWSEKVAELTRMPV